MPPQTGEIFNDLEYYKRRLRGYLFAEGFDIVRKGGGLKSNLSLRLLYLHYGITTQNTRRLENEVERDEDGNIISRRQWDNIIVGQLGYK